MSEPRKPGRPRGVKYSTQIAVRVEPEDLAALKDIARRRVHSLAETVRQLVREEAARERRKGKL